MTFINTNGMSFIGPGSEWFWTAVSGIVLAVTFLAIYRQLRLQRAAAASDQLDALLREWSSERLARAKLALLQAMQAGVVPERLPARPLSHIGFFWNRIGYLVQMGHMDRRLVYEQLGDQIQWWWAALGPWVRWNRMADRDPTSWHHFELLASSAAAFDAKRGVVRRVDPDGLAAALPSLIEMFSQAVELEEALRAVTVRISPLPIPVQLAVGAVPV
jgi:hypothetical protein